MSSTDEKKWVAVAHPLVEGIPPTPCLVNWPKVADGMDYTLIKKPSKIQPGDDICFVVDESKYGGRVWMYYGHVESTDMNNGGTSPSWTIVTTNRGRYRYATLGVDDDVYFKSKEKADG
jgi:hypothetical protein